MTNINREKVIVIHTDYFLDNQDFQDKRLVDLQKNLRVLLDEAEKDGKRIVRIDKSSPDEIEEGDLYLVGDDVSSKQALRVINSGDEIALAGLYEDVCLGIIFRAAVSLGAKPRIMQNLTIKDSELSQG